MRFPKEEIDKIQEDIKKTILKIDESRVKDAAKEKGITVRRRVIPPRSR